MLYLYIICAENISVLSSIEFHKELFIGPKSIEVVEGGSEKYKFMMLVFADFTLLEKDWQ